MAECTIRLVSNPKTGKRDIYIDYDSEDDALPHEHEKDHRALVEKLLGQGILSPDDLGQIVVQRGEPGLAEPQQSRQEPNHRQSVAEGQEGQ